MTGALLKEAVDDLEWASGGGAVHLHMRRDPPLVTLSAHGAGDLKITLPVRRTVHPALGKSCAVVAAQHAGPCKLVEVPGVFGLSIPNQSTVKGVLRLWTPASHRLSVSPAASCSAAGQGVVETHSDGLFWLCWAGRRTGWTASSPPRRRRAWEVVRGG